MLILEKWSSSQVGSWLILDKWSDRDPFVFEKGLGSWLIHSHIECSHYLPAAKNKWLYNALNEEDGD